METGGPAAGMIHLVMASRPPATTKWSKPPLWQRVRITALVRLGKSDPSWWGESSPSTPFPRPTPQCVIAAGVIAENSCPLVLSQDSPRSTTKMHEGLTRHMTKRRRPSFRRMAVRLLRSRCISILALRVPSWCFVFSVVKTFRKNEHARTFHAARLTGEPFRNRAGLLFPPQEHGGPSASVISKRSRANHPA
jgi:hypothetical protein